MKVKEGFLAIEQSQFEKERMKRKKERYKMRKTRQGNGNKERQERIKTQ